MPLGMHRYLCEDLFASSLAGFVAILADFLYAGTYH